LLKLYSVPDGVCVSKPWSYCSTRKNSRGQHPPKGQHSLPKKNFISGGQYARLKLIW